MITGSCHCGEIRFVVQEMPEKITNCNCTVCRRYGVLWAHMGEEDIEFTKSPNATFTYVCNDEIIAFHICRTCGNMSHWEYLEGPFDTIALNMRLVDPDHLQNIPIVHSDGLNE